MQTVIFLKYYNQVDVLLRKRNNGSVGMCIATVSIIDAICKSCDEPVLTMRIVI